MLLPSRVVGLDARHSWTRSGPRAGGCPPIHSTTITPAFRMDDMLVIAQNILTIHVIKATQYYVRLGG